MVEGIESEREVVVPGGHIKEWFARALTIITIKLDDNNKSISSKKAPEHFQKCPQNMRREDAFVQLYEVIHSECVFVDEIDTFLKCVRLKLQRPECEEVQMPLSRKFGLLPIDFVQGRVNFVNMDG